MISSLSLHFAMSTLPSIYFIILQINYRYLWYNLVFASEILREKLKYVLVVFVKIVSESFSNYTLFDIARDSGIRVSKVISFGGLIAG